MRLPAILVIAILVFLGTRYYLSRKMLYYPVSVTQDRLAHIRSTVPDAQEIWVPVGGKKMLHGWFWEKNKTGLPTVFYFGGNAEEVSVNLEPFSACLSASAVLVNYRGYGQSKGSPTEARLKQDALAVFDHMADRLNLDPARCVAWGRSLGSSMAAHLALERGLGQLILTCPFDSIQAVAAVYYPEWLVNLVLEDRHRTLDFAPRIQSSTLVLAAPGDEVIPFRLAQNLYDSLTGPKKLVPVHGAGHNTISGFEAYFDAVNAFLKTGIQPTDLPQKMLE
jgi:uncharacterized protein